MFGKFFQSLPIPCGVLCRRGGGGPGKLRNFLIWEFWALWQLLPNWQLMDLAQERFKFRHPVDGWCAGGWITLAQCDPMETGVRHPVDGWCAGGCWIILAQCDPMETMGWNWDFVGFHGWGETAPQGSVYLVSSFFFFFPLNLFLIMFFFFPLLSLFSWAFIFLSFFFFLK